MGSCKDPAPLGAEEMAYIAHHSGVCQASPGYDCLPSCLLPQPVCVLKIRHTSPAKREVAGSSPVIRKDVAQLVRALTFVVSLVAATLGRVGTRSIFANLLPRFNSVGSRQFYGVTRLSGRSSPTLCPGDSFLSYEDGPPRNEAKVCVVKSTVTSFRSKSFRPRLFPPKICSSTVVLSVGPCVGAQSCKGEADTLATSRYVSSGSTA